MLRFMLLSCLATFYLASQVCAQTMEDVVHLKNGSVIRGAIIEQVPDESPKVRIQTQDGSVFVCTMEEIARMAKESSTDEALPVKKDAPATGVEIGTLFGITRSSSFRDGITSIQVPSSSLLGGVGPISSLPALYLSWFPSERVAIGPEVALGRISQDGGSFTSFLLGCRAAFFVRSSSIFRQPKGHKTPGRHSVSAPGGSAMRGIYVLGQGSLWTIQDSGNFRFNGIDDTDFSAGLGLGHLWLIGSALTLQIEVQYRRWFDAEFNNFSLVFGVGTRLGRTSH